MNRYPRLGTVSMKRGVSATSPSASRRRFDRVVEAGNEIYKSVSRPQALPQFIAGYDLPWMLQQKAVYPHLL